MSDQKTPAYEGTFALVPTLNAPELIVSALDYLEETLLSNIVLDKGTKEHKRAVDTYRAILDIIIDRLDGVANMKCATGYPAAPHMLGQVIATTDAQARSPFLNQLGCIRPLAETDFSVLPDRFISIDAKFRPEQPLEPIVSEVIRLTKDDMPTDEDKAAFDRLVAIDEKSWMPRHPRAVQYVQPNPEPIDTFHARKESQIADISRLFGLDDSMVRQLREDDKNYAETIHAMRMKATELAGTRRDDLPIADLLS